MSDTNKRVVLARHPTGLPADADFRIEEVALPPVLEGEFLVKVKALGIEPRLRIMLNPTREWNKGMRPHGAMADIGRVVPGSVLGEVVESQNPKYPVGQLVEGLLGWQQYAVTTGAPHPTNNPEGIALCDRALSVRDEDHIAALGAPGLTAWLAIEEEGKPQPGETVVITSAAGMVGGFAGQFAKLKGARVIGITSTAEKKQYLTEELGFDAAVSYKDADWVEQLRKLAPKGVDYHFDNVGGDMSATINSMFTAGARHTRCGIVSKYTKTEWNQTEEFAGQFSVHNHVDRYPEARRAISALLKSGTIRYRLTVHEGLASAPGALRGLLEGRNIGKWVVRVD